MSIEQALISAKESLSQGQSHADIARGLVQQHGLQATDLVAVLKQTLKPTPIKRKSAKATSLAAAAPSDTYVADATYLASLLVSAIPGVTPTDVATALIDPRNYPDLTAYQMGEILMSTGVFPSITSADMQTALLAAGYPSTDVDATITQLYPSDPPVVTPPVSTTYRRMGSAGVSGQMPFDDTAQATAGQPITQLRVQSGNIIDNLQAFYGSGLSPAPAHGGTGGHGTIIMIPPGDALVEVSGYTGYWFGGNYVLQLTFKSRKGNTYGSYGDMSYSNSQTPFTFRVESNEQIVGFFGSVTYGDNGNLTLLGSLGVIIQTN